MNTTNAVAADALPSRQLEVQGRYVVLCRVSLWSGGVTVDAREDFHGENLPPKSLFSGGVMPVLDKTVLTEFETIRSQMRRDCLAAGHRFGSPNLYLVDEAKGLELYAKLKEREAEFEHQLQNTLLPALDILYEAWEEQHAPWAEVLRRRRPTPAKVRAAMSTIIAFTHMVPPQGNPVLQQSFAGLQEGAFQDLCFDVAQRAREIHLKSFTEGNGGSVKASVRQTALNSVRTLLDKVDDFAGFDPRARPIVQLLQRTLAMLPKTGPVSGADLMTMVTTLRALSDPAQLVADATTASSQLSQTAWSASEADDEQDNDLFAPQPIDATADHEEISLV